jgi:hypothetical protein
VNSPLENPEGLSWVAAAVQLPELPLLPPGQDAMSMTIAGVLPTLTAPFNASVAALSAKETMFSGKLGAAQTAYQDADDSGQQSVGQLAGMLGQVGHNGAGGRLTRSVVRRSDRHVRSADATGHAGAPGRRRLTRRGLARRPASRPWARSNRRGRSTAAVARRSRYQAGQGTRTG